MKIECNEKLEFITMLNDDNVVTSISYDLFKYYWYIDDKTIYYSHSKDDLLDYKNNKKRGYEVYSDHYQNVLEFSKYTLMIDELPHNVTLPSGLIEMEILDNSKRVQ